MQLNIFRIDSCKTVKALMIGHRLQYEVKSKAKQRHQG